MLAKGIDPVEHAKLEKIAKILAAARTFEAVASEWLEGMRRRRCWGHGT